MKRIGIAQIWQESNHFNPVATTVADFHSFGYGVGAEGLVRAAGSDEVRGFVEGLRFWNRAAEPLGLVFAQAWPSGPLDVSTRRHLLETLLTRLKNLQSLDGLLFSLHGALVAEDEFDVDGMLLEEVRRVVGRDVPMVATLDLHAQLTPRMLHSADVILAYQTNPHVDRRETGLRAAGVLERRLLGIRPARGAFRLPMLATGEQGTTSGPVLAEVFERVRQIEAEACGLSAAVLMVQPCLDVPKLGWSTLVYTDGRKDLAEGRAAELAEACWARRKRLVSQYPLYGASEAIDRALACAGKPVVIADGADATNSGAPGDSVHLVGELVGRRIAEGALAIMVDPQAVAYARQLGEGGAFRFAVGGKRDHVFSKPLAVEGRVLFVKEARYTLSGHLSERFPVDMGLAAAVRIADLTLLLVEKTGPGSSPLMYRCVDLEPKDYKIVVVKSPAGFRAEFTPFAAEIILAACPGCASPILQHLPYTRISRPLWPLDAIDDRRQVPWCRGGLR